MPPPKFITCQICGRGFGSASINIHIPQCYDKALKRWQLNPVGPKPVMPYASSAGGPTKGKRLTASKADFDVIPAGAGGTAARSLKANNVDMMSMEAAPENLNLHPCRKCGRKFNYDRIAYHESVCKGDQKRPVFDMTKQRMPEEALCGSGGGGYMGSARRGKKKGGAAAASPPIARYPRAPQSTWRQQHEEFIEAVRAARRSDQDSKAMWGNDSYSAAASAGRRAGKPAPKAAPASRRVPAPMTKVDESRKRNMATGGRAARAQPSSISTPVPPDGGNWGAARGHYVRNPGSIKPSAQRNAFGGGGDRFANYGSGRPTGGGGGGGGGGGRIINDNTSSIGMKQAFGQA